MTIRYTDGRVVEAVLVSRADETIRVVIRGTDDVTQFRNINGSWVSEYCEPARIEFAWERRQKGSKPAISDADFCVSHELAARLIHLLISDDTNADEVAPPMPAVDALDALLSTIGVAAAAVN